MKRFIGIGVFLLALTIASTDVFAWSLKRGAEFIKNPSRCATVNTVDAAQYNPAGLINLQDGLYIYLGNQAAFKKYTTQVRSAAIGYMRDATDTTPAFLSPNATLAYVVGSGAVFATFDVIGGGGTLRYHTPEGVNFGTFMATMAGSSAKVSQVVVSEAKTAISVGVSYGLFNDKVSLSAGIRYVMVDRGVTANMNFARAASQTASMVGWTGFIGINIQPTQMFNIAVLFQPTARLAGEWHDKISHQRGSVGTYGSTVLGGLLTFTSHSQEYEDGYITVGAGIRPMEALEIQLSFKYSFDSERRYGNYASGTTSVLTENNGSRQGWDAAIGFEYSLGLVRPSLGIMYSRTADTNMTNIGQPWDPGLSSTFVGLGVSIVPNDTIRIDLGAAKVFYANGSAMGGTFSYKKDVWLIGYGIGLRF